MITIYHNPRCRKSREGLEILKESGKEFSVREYLSDVPSENELSDVLDKLSMEPEQLLRKGEQDFKENFTGKQLTREEWIKAMVKYPKLIERPIVIVDNSAVVGRPPEKIRELI